MEKIKILIAEDEAPARKKLTGFIKRTEINCDIVETDNGISAVEKYYEWNPDILFLDIQMPGMTGFEVLEQIQTEHLPAIIFATAYDQYAIKAFDVSAVDYLLKPFDYDRFYTAFAKALKEAAGGRQTIDALKLLLKETKSGQKYKERILVNTGQRYFFINVDDILYISSNEKYVTLNTTEGKYLFRETMRNMEDELNSEKFARIHRSYIVNLSAVKEMKPLSHGDYTVILNNKERLTLSRRYRGRVFG